MTNDQLFKEAWQELFQELMTLFFPDIAARLDFSEIIFLDKEFFTDFPGGSQREPDLIAQVKTLTGRPEILMVHVEIEAKKRRTFRARFCEYYAVIRLRYRMPIFPLVMYLSPGAGGIHKETYIETTFGDEVLRFTYTALGLRDLPADDYLRDGDPVSSAFSAMMRVSALSRPVRKLRALQEVAKSEQNEARRVLLSNIIEKGLELGGDEAVEYERLASAIKAEEATEMISIYEERGIEKGRKAAREEMEPMLSVYEERGIEKGIKAAREEMEPMLSVYEERGIEKGIKAAREEMEPMLSVYEERGIEKGIKAAREEMEPMLSVYEERGIEKGIKAAREEMEPMLSVYEERGIEKGIKAAREEMEPMLSVYEERGIEKGIKAAREEMEPMLSVYEERGIEKGIKAAREEMEPMLSVYEERGIEKGIKAAREEMEPMLSVYEERGVEKGKAEMQPLLSVYEERGIEIGLEKGKAEMIPLLTEYEERGINQGQNRMLLELLRHKFGEAALEMQPRIEALESSEERNRLMLRVMDAATLEDFRQALDA